MTRLSAPELRKKHFLAKLVVTGVVLTVPLAVLAAPASAETVNHDVTQGDNSWDGDQGDDHSHDWNHGGNGGQGGTWDQGGAWDRGDGRGQDNRN
ncbi:hypothetical protein O4214_11920 [Rhodococcus erythropolis]|uniref:hypothetical protein n=1 Tax=Rhodococcus erythropolis TaxID=1833 RepID=UPI001E48EF1D|nr:MULTISPECIES: hypothetical protein [Rhodococcus erythropolis group]MCD2106263.1 hypothetical protein [Rhodococcus qingshengii]MCZ4524689.1 hypothetical protein [Rhodococcus erythropolis]